MDTSAYNKKVIDIFKLSNGYKRLHIAGVSIFLSQSELQMPLDGRSE